MSDLLKVQDLHMWIQTDKGLNHILQGVQLDIQPGEIHGLIGESGCGKTMMTKATLNLIDPKRTVIRGHIEFDGQELEKLPEKERRKIGGSRIGYITQDPLTALNPLYTVGEQIAEMLSIEKLVHEECPPAFIWHTSNDSGVNVINSYLYATALRKHGIPHEMHVFPNGPHGLGVAADRPHIHQWVNLMQNWLIDLGWL